MILWVDCVSVMEPPELKRCTKKAAGGKWHCPVLFDASDPRKMCEKCRAQSSRFFKSDTGKRIQAKSRKKNRTKIAETARVKYQENPQKFRDRNDAYNRSVKGQAFWEKMRIMRRVNSAIRIALKNVRSPDFPSKTVKCLGVFSGDQDVRQHFESTWENWMSWDNYGAHRSGNAYNERWNNGHILPVSIFDATKEDMRKCFDRRNQRAQCARKNVETQAKLLLDDSTLIALRDLWPAAANDDLITLKSLFRSVELSVGTIESDTDSEGWLA